MRRSAGVSLTLVSADRIRILLSNAQVGDAGGFTEELVWGLWVIGGQAVDDSDMVPGNRWIGPGLFLSSLVLLG